MTERQTVLIIDEERQFTEDLSHHLAEQSYDTVVAVDDEEARKLADVCDPDAVIVGTIRPRGAAFHLHRWFRGDPTFRDIPLIVVDVPPEKQLTRGWRRDEGMQMEAYEYFQKPVRIEAVADAVRRSLSVRRKRIRVLVADDHAMVREGIRALLSLHEDIVIVGEAVDGAEAVEKARDLSPDVVLMDIVMPHMNGLEATRQIRGRSATAQIVMLTQYDDDEYVAESTRAGARDFISKRDASSRLVETIRATE